jgi:hypothetical protein
VPGAAGSASAGHLLGGSGRHHPLAVSINVRHFIELPISI